MKRLFTLLFAAVLALFPFRASAQYLAPPWFVFGPSTLSSSGTYIVPRGLSGQNCTFGATISGVATVVPNVYDGLQWSPISAYTAVGAQVANAAASGSYSVLSGNYQGLELVVTISSGTVTLSGACGPGIPQNGAGAGSSAAAPAFFESLSVGTPVQASASCAAAAICSATLPAAVGKTTYLTSLAITTGPAAAVVSGLAMVSGSATTLNYYIVEPVATGGQLLVNLANPLAASAADTAIVVTLPAVAGGAISAVSATGYQL